jgi:hypothetical protein
MQQPGLYFPFVHIRDDNWLKAAVLYWPSVRRLVPRNYVKHDSPTAQHFFDAEVLRDEDPRGLLDSMTWDLLDALRSNADRLERDYSVERAYADWDGNHRLRGSAPEWEVPELGWIHVTKFPRGVVRYLAERGLAHRGRGGDGVWSDPRAPNQWIGLHPALAGAYMTALAGRLGELASFQPLTDQDDLRVATPNSDVRSAMHLLLGRKQESQDHIDTADGVEAYVMLALQHVIPGDLAGVPPSKIIECREDLASELLAFREYVAAQQADLAELTTLPIARRRLEAFAEHVEQSVELPLRNLEKGMRLLKLEPTRSLLLAGSVAPPVVAGAGLTAAGAGPVIASTVGALVAIGSAWWQVESLRAGAKAASPVGYLLDVRDRLTPKTLATRARRLLRGTYGGQRRQTRAQ